MSAAWLLCHTFAGGFVTVLMFAFAVTINVQHTLMKHQAEEIAQLRQRIAIYRDELSRGTQARIRSIFESECG